MCDFKPGDEVVCVEAGGPYHVEGFGVFRLVLNQTYTIAEVAPAGSPTAMGRVVFDMVQLVEFGHVETPTIYGCRANRFRKVQRRDLKVWLATENTIEGPRRDRVKAVSQ